MTRAMTPACAVTGMTIEAEPPKRETMYEKTLNIKKLAGMPHHAADVINGMHPRQYEGANTFMDRYGQHIDCADPHTDKLFAPRAIFRGIMPLLLR